MPPARRSMRRTARRTSRRTSRRVDRRQEATSGDYAEPAYDEAPQDEPAPPTEADKYADLERIAELHEQGILTDEEFDIEKKKILG